MPFTEIPNYNNNIVAGATYTEETSRWKCINRTVSRNCYTIASRGINNANLKFYDTICFTPHVEHLNVMDRQASLIGLSRTFGLNTKEIDESFLKVLNATTKRQFSKEPTRL